MIDEHTLQKLVDGELENNQIRILLRDADRADSDANQAHWKQMAVAFVENQLMQKSFSDFNSALSSSPSSAERANILNASPARQKTVTGVSNRALWTSILAASLLIGVALLSRNFVFNSLTLTPSSIANGTTSITAGIDAVSDDNKKPLLPFDQRTLLALTPDHQLNPDLLPSTFGRKGQRQVPLYEANRFDRRQLNQLRSNDSAAKRAWFDQVMPTGSVDDQMVADCEKAGMFVDQEIEFLSGRLDDGRPYMIPYRSVRFSSGQ